MVGTTNTSKPLGQFAELSRTVLYYEPRTVPPSASDPSLIVMCPWMAAADPHIAKYTEKYQELWPTSRILIVKATLDILANPWWSADLGPALTVLRSQSGGMEGNSASSGGAGTRVLIHVFSNGGLSALRSLAIDYGSQHDGKAASAREASLPRHVVVMDSCPGYYDWDRGVNAWRVSLPRILHPLIYVAMVGHFLAYRVTGLPSFFELNAATMLHSGILKQQAGRTYIYGTEDDIVSATHVEDDVVNATKAAKAMNGEGPVVRSERFEGSRHCSHMRIDPERYWTTVKETWERG